MNKEIKKAVFFPAIAITSIVGLLGAVEWLTNFTEDIKLKAIIILSIAVVSLVYIVIRFYLIMKKDKKEISDLKSNNSGLIEAKNNYLSENTSLKQDISKHQQDMALLIGDNNKLRDLFKNIITQILKRDLAEEDQREIFDLILRGNKNGTKELENYKDNR